MANQSNPMLQLYVNLAYMEAGMGRAIHRLTARKVATVKPGRSNAVYADGGGLYLQVAAERTDTSGRPVGGSKQWVFRFMLFGRARKMGLGGIHTVSLAEARNEAERYRKMVRDGIDPIEHRNRERAAQRIEASSSKTFRECAEAYIKAHRAGWKNAKHAGQWGATLETYAYPNFGDQPVNVIDTAMVLRVLEPIWNVKTETASRVRGRIEAVLDWAAVRGYRKGDNPARWKGHLAALLPAKTTVRAVKHQRALPYEEFGAFMKRLRAMDGISPRALEFQILTAVRPGEALGARWSEIDRTRKTWTIPGARMKGGKGQRDHVVPLSDAALAVLSDLGKCNDPESGGNAFVFPGSAPGRPLSNMAPMSVIKRMGLADRATAHGFRSTFRDWAAETTAYPNHVCEMALAHSIDSKVEASYRRGDLLDKRRRLMNEWATFADKAEVAADGANVVQIGAAL